MGHTYSFKLRNKFRVTGKCANIWFTSDTHFGHRNIIDYVNRPFNSVEEMDDTYISNHNSLVEKYDLFFHLGDVYFTGKSKYQFNMLHGVKHIIKGNHDYKGSFKGVDAELLDPIHQIKIDDKEVVLCHYPIFSWNGKIHGSIHLYGHVHNHEDEQLPLKNAVNIGVDMWGYCPVDFKTILEVIKDKEV